MMRATLPTYMLAMIVQISPDSSRKISGPGWSPYIVKTKRSSAVVADPGMPRLKRGTIAPPTPALFAASGPATPSIAPLPNSSFRFEIRFSMM
ncbi:Uncharacterised protein [Mycobacteroides abscessus subsp. abscessus]|nr:Uncharacterised protein [Mycobacteroides abscessus subsp. abscessus]